MPIPLRPLEKVVEKWRGKTTAASSDYVAGVQAPKYDWQAQSLAAKDAWKAGVTDAAGRGAFEKGVAKKGTAFWQKRTLDLGPGRFTDGVTKSVDVYKGEFASFYDALGKIELPARGARGDPKNLERVRTIMETMRKVKTSA